MSISLQPLALISATDFAGVAARANSPRRSSFLAPALQPDIAILEHHQHTAPERNSSSMPTTEQLMQLRYAAMSEAVRRLIGGNAKLN